MKKYIVIFIILLIIPLINAATIRYTYLDAGGQPINGFNAVIYETSSKLKIGSTYTTTNNYLDINYPNTPSNYNTYHFKDNFVSYQKTMSGDIELPFFKATNCGTNSIIEVPSTGIVNQPVTITVNINKNIADIFGSFLVGGYPTFVPDELINYFSVDTKVSLNVDGIIKENKDIKINNTYPIILFSWTPTEVKSYIIKVITEVKDNQCQSFTAAQESSSKSITVTAQSQPEQQAVTCTLNTKQCYNTSILQTCTQSSPAIWTNTSCNCLNNQCVTSSSTTTEKCTDNTPVGSCSTTKPKYCNNLKRLVSNSSACGCDTGLIQYNNLCVQPANNTEVIPTPTCTEAWLCASEWSVCKDNEQTRECIDQNGCSPIKLETKPCTVISEKPTVNPDVKNFNEVTNASINALLGRISDGIEEIIESSKYQILILFLIILSIIGYTIYYLQSHKGIIKIKPKSKPEKKPVKINDLMLSIIDSLDADERELCYTIIENEGILQDELKNKTNLTKTKMEIALTKLERRQVIRKREGLNPRIYINDWLK